MLIDLHHIVRYSSIRADEVKEKIAVIGECHSNNTSSLAIELRDIECIVDGGIVQTLNNQLLTIQHLGEVWPPHAADSC